MSLCFLLLFPSLICFLAKKEIFAFWMIMKIVRWLGFMNGNRNRDKPGADICIIFIIIIGSRNNCSWTVFYATIFVQMSSFVSSKHGPKAWPLFEFHRLVAARQSAPKRPRFGFPRRPFALVVSFTVVSDVAATGVRVVRRRWPPRTCVRLNEPRYATVARLNQWGERNNYKLDFGRLKQEF